MVADHSLSEVMHSQAGEINHTSAHTQAMACVLTIHAAVWKTQYYKCQWMYTGTGQHMKYLYIGVIPFNMKRRTRIATTWLLCKGLCIIYEANCGFRVLSYGSSLFHEIMQLQYASCMKHTVVFWPFSLDHAYVQQKNLGFCIYYCFFCMDDVTASIS